MITNILFQNGIFDPDNVFWGYLYYETPVPIA